MTVDIPQLDDRGLRKFGLTTAAVVVVLFGLLLPWLFNAKTLPPWPWIVAGLLTVPAVLLPCLLNLVYLVWMKIGHGLGWINSRIILGMVFYTLVLPMGLVMRLLGKDPMRRQREESATSYRVASQRTPRERLEKPY